MFKQVHKLPTVLQTIGISRSSLYQQINDGLFVSPIKLGKRSVAWLPTEVDTILSARIAGLSEKSIKEIVSNLHLKRMDGVK